MSCEPSFNLLEKDLSTSKKNKIAFGVPILEYKDADSQPLVPGINETQRIG